MSNLEEQPLISHLLELRTRVTRMVIAILVLLVAFFPFGNDIYIFVAAPLMDVMPEGTSMIATQVASPFLTPFKLALVTAVFVAMPYLLHQLWSFIAPGLYQHEKRLAVPLLASSVILFYAGAAFAYFVVFPLVFAFLTSVAPEGVAVATDITAYLDFVLTLFFAFGISFEVPIATILLVLAGMTTPDKLAQKRPFVVVGAFVIGMLLTPPDVISQTLLAVPIWLLFEVGIFFSRLLKRKPKSSEEEKSIGGALTTTGAAAASGTSEAKQQVYEGEYEDDDDEYRPLTDEEMEAELDAMEEDEDDEPEENGKKDEADSAELETVDGEEKPYEVPTDFVPDAVDNKLEWIMTLREEGRLREARKLLYEVLAEGNETQKKVARNILDQFDT
ncbi:MAG: twin-arginine translocase subunit TatC [Sedimenticolaceae bacterium]|jgi:sec-independent protein translocase protein TatC